MNTAGWGPDERAEWLALLEEVCGQTSATAERARLLIEGVEDACQARRYWARDVQREWEQRGAQAMVTEYAKSQRRLAIAFNGQLLTKTGVIGRKRRRADGSVYDEQVLFEMFTRDEVLAKMADYRKNRDAYGVDLHIMGRLLALLDAVPDVQTCGEAAARLGTTVDAWLAAGE